MPVYNSEKTIRNSIDSILKQTYKNWILIIVDDGST
ncbi:glycosyltransferase family A protein, partial [Rhizobium ruizarguesonis]